MGFGEPKEIKGFYNEINKGAFIYSFYFRALALTTAKVIKIIHL